MKYQSPFKIRARSVELANLVSMGLNTYRSRFIVQASFISAAVLLGVVAVYFNAFITAIQRYHAAFYAASPYITTALTPLGFLASVAVVKYLSPSAGGSGVPQVLHAAALTNDENQHVVSSGLLSMKTAVVKTVSSGLGFLSGASIGGEGPTVQISGAIFATIGDFTRRYFPNIDYRSYIVAGGGTGVAAAFNTPLGGVAFALEEVALSSFGGLRHAIMLAVIIAGLTARGLIGDDLYLGHFTVARGEGNLLLWSILVGAVCGVMGGVFGKIVSSERLYRLKVNWWQRAMVCGILVALIGLVLNDATAGSGYLLTKAYMDESVVQAQPWYFALAKLVATALSTLSGMGGGILAPSITIGGWAGIAIAKLSSVDPKIFALLGMAAYFSSAFQIPVTAVVIVMEMTNQHDYIIPMMLASLVAYGIGRIIMPVSLYHVLIERSFHKKTLSD